MLRGRGDERGPAPGARRLGDRRRAGGGRRRARARQPRQPVPLAGRGADGAARAHDPLPRDPARHRRHELLLPGARRRVRTRRRLALAHLALLLRRGGVVRDPRPDGLRGAPPLCARRRRLRAADLRARARALARSRGRRRVRGPARALGAVPDPVAVGPLVQPRRPAGALRPARLRADRPRPAGARVGSVRGGAAALPHPLPLLRRAARRLLPARARARARSPAADARSRGGDGGALGAVAPVALRGGARAPLPGAPRERERLALLPRELRPHPGRRLPRPGALAARGTAPRAAARAPRRAHAAARARPLERARARRAPHGPRPRAPRAAEPRRLRALPDAARAAALRRGRARRGPLRTGVAGSRGGRRGRLGAHRSARGPRLRDHPRLRRPGRGHRRIPARPRAARADGGDRLRGPAGQVLHRAAGGRRAHRRGPRGGARRGLDPAAPAQRGPRLAERARGLPPRPRRGRLRPLRDRLPRHGLREPRGPAPAPLPHHAQRAARRDLGPTPVSGSENADPRGTWLAVAACVAAGTVLRAIPCTNDFWLDEIWTWQSAQQLHSALGVFTEIHHSNNHHLNTLLFYWLGDQRAWALYRLPSLVAGSATIALAAAIAGRRGRLEALLAAALSAASFALVYYSSEARGYSLAVCLALVALLALLRFFERGGAGAAALFATATCLGLLSQLVFVFFWSGALAWTALRLERRPEPASARLADALRLHAAPALALLLLYLVDLRHLRVGGGPPAVAGEIAARTLGYTLGLPVRPELGGAYAALALGLLALALRRLARERDDLWVLHLVAIALAPAAILAAARPEVIDLRYFLIGIALFLILLARLAAGALRAGGWRRAAAAAGLAVFFLGNGVHAARFLELGRGGFQAALRYMAEHSAGPAIVVGSDQDFRNAIVLRFYARLLPSGRSLDYRKRSEWPPGGPEWIVVHRRERPRRPLPELSFDDAGRYRLAAEFDYGGISGFYWGIYRRSSDAGNAPTDPGAAGSRGRSRRGRRARARSAPRARRRPRPTRAGAGRCAGRGRRARRRTQRRRGGRGPRSPAGRSAGPRASPPRRRPRSRSGGRAGSGSDSFAGASS